MRAADSTRAAPSSSGGPEPPAAVGRDLVLEMVDMGLFSWRLPGAPDPLRGRPAPVSRGASLFLSGSPPRWAPRPPVRGERRLAGGPRLSIHGCRGGGSPRPCRRRRLFGRPACRRSTTAGQACSASRAALRWTGRRPRARRPATRPGGRPSSWTGAGEQAACAPEWGRPDSTPPPPASRCTKGLAPPRGGRLR